MQLTLGELIHKVVGNLLELGCIESKQFLETLNFIGEVLGKRSHRHGQSKQGTFAPSAWPSRLARLLQFRRDAVCVRERIGDVRACLQVEKPKRRRDFRKEPGNVVPSRPTRPIRPQGVGVTALGGTIKWMYFHV